MVENYINGGIAGIVEVSLLNPIDFIKTKFQVLPNKSKLKYFYKITKRYGHYPYYRGYIPRLLGVVPMRILFFGSLTTAQKYTTTYAGIIAGSIQTLIDCPIENYKIKSMLNVKNVKLYRGFFPHLIRNVGFASIFQLCRTYLPFDDFTNGAIGGGLGSILTQPFDTLKTIEQTNLKIKNFNREILFRGGMFRTLQGFLAMGIGNVVYNMNYGRFISK